MVNRRRDHQYGLFLEGIDYRLAELGHIGADFLDILFEREGGVSV